MLSAVNKSRARKRKIRKKIATKTVIQQVAVKPSGRRKRGGGRGRRTGLGITLSDCALQYARAIGDPWSELAIGACVPMPAGLTQKVTGFIRGAAEIGNQGTGFILMAPCLANNLPSLWFTTNAFSHGDLRPFSAANTLSNGVFPSACGSLPYATAQFGVSEDANRQSLSGRIVSASIRCWYIGTAQVMAGQVYALREPYHASVQTAYGLPANIQALGQRRETRVYNNDRTQRSVADFAYDTEETNMSSWQSTQNNSNSVAVARTRLMYPYSHGESLFTDGAGNAITFTDVAGVLVGVPTSVLFFTGTPGQQLAFEYCIHVEYAGPATAALGTRSLADVDGTNRVMDAAALASNAAQRNDDPGMWKTLVDSIAQVEAAVRPHFSAGVKLATGVANMYVQSRRAQRGALMMQGEGKFDS